MFFFFFKKKKKLLFEIGGQEKLSQSHWKNHVKLRTLES